MTIRWNRLALGGVLAGVITFLGSPAARAQLPAAPYGPPPTPPGLPAQPGPPGQPVYYPGNPSLPPGYNTSAPFGPQAAQPAPKDGQPVPTGTGTGKDQPGSMTDTPGKPSTSTGPKDATPAPKDGAAKDGKDGAKAPNPLSMTARWNVPNPGVWIETADKDFVLHVGGTIHEDFAWYSASPLLELAPGGTGKFQDGANLRRARVYFEGTFYHQVDYKLEMEFMNGVGTSPAGTTNPVIPQSVINTPGPTDAWINVKQVPFFGNIRVGNQKEWFSLEHINNYRALEFMERSYLFDLSQATRFNNGFSPGVSVFRTWLEERVFSGVGVYKNISTPIGFGFGDGQYAVTGRLASLLVEIPDEHMFWEFGGAMSHRDPVGGQVVTSIRDNVRNAPFSLLNILASTGTLNARSQDLFNFETAAVIGSLTLQAEWTGDVLHGASTAATATAPTGPALGDLFFQGYYAEAMWLLTGESRTFNRSIYAMNRVVPKNPLRFRKRTDCDCDDGYGFGAWEVAVRYSYLDLSNKAIMGGRLQSVTLGLNWYLNTAAKIQFNYDYTQRGDTANAAQGHVHAFGSRCAFDF